MLKGGKDFTKLKYSHRHGSISSIRKKMQRHTCLPGANILDREEVGIELRRR